jgi:hypothetical protein
MKAVSGSRKAFSFPEYVTFQCLRVQGRFPPFDGSCVATRIATVLRELKSTLTYILRKTIELWGKAGQSRSGCFRKQVLFRMALGSRPTKPVARFQGLALRPVVKLPPKKQRSAGKLG